MKRMRGTRRQAQAVGLLVCVPTLLLAALPALAQLVDEHLTSDHAGWAARERPARVSQGAPVEITGSTRRPLFPGASARISLRFMNAIPSPVTLTRVRVRIIRIDAPQADATYPCGRADFKIQQMPVLTLQVPGGGRVATLYDVGVPLRDWPQLIMINRPVNQDGCKGARLTLGYRAQGGRWP